MKKIAVLLLLSSIQSAFAADITTLQASLEMARQNMESAKSRYTDARNALSNQEKSVQRLKTELDKEQKQLVIDKNNAKTAMDDYYAAKGRHDRAQAILDKAWEKR
ncbi:MAG TPA: hypothetical protein PLK99_07695 [Burkholderiales bacterium]|nr:hypothetical protein [Burkholderiales bacterium]